MEQVVWKGVASPLPAQKRQEVTTHLAHDSPYCRPFMSAECSSAASALAFLL